MWKILIFNNIWFAILLLAHLYAGRMVQLFVFFSIFLVAWIVAAFFSIDPVAWLFYLFASWLSFWAVKRFRRWSVAALEVLDQECRKLSKKLEAQQKVLAEKADAVRQLDQRANEIVHLYDEMNQMSQSLDASETLLIFGGLLSTSHEFENLKLVLFSSENAGVKSPAKVLELSSKSLRDFSDSHELLKKMNQANATLFPLDEEWLEQAFQERKLFWRKAPTVLVQPILLEQKVFAVLIIIGIQARDMRTLSLLMGRFVSEMQRIRLYEGIEKLAITDGLTGVMVRRYLLERLETELERSKKYSLACSFLMVDIDDFKNFNDCYGHLVGDMLLKQVADTIKKNVRELDLVGRYGGEEFGVLLVETGEGQALLVAERIRQAVQEKDFSVYDENLKATVSVGCTSCSERINQGALLVDAADSALYQAKRQGKNRACLYAGESL